MTLQNLREKKSGTRSYPGVTLFRQANITYSYALLLNLTIYPRLTGSSPWSSTQRFTSGGLILKGRVSDCVAYTLCFICGSQLLMFISMWKNGVAVAVGYTPQKRQWEGKEMWRKGKAKPWDTFDWKTGRRTLIGEGHEREERGKRRRRQNQSKFCLESHNETSYFICWLNELVIW